MPCLLVVCWGCNRCADWSLHSSFREKFEQKIEVAARNQSAPRFADGSCRCSTPPNAPPRPKWAARAEGSARIARPLDASINQKVVGNIELESLELTSEQHHLSSHIAFRIVPWLRVDSEQ